MNILLLLFLAQTHDVQVATTVAFTEGPTVDASGAVLFTDATSRRIMKLSPDGALSVFRENSNAANGLIFDAQWRLIACEGNPANPRVTRTDMKTGRIEVLAAKGLAGPNDVTLDGKGRIYFTDPGPGPTAVRTVGPAATVQRPAVPESVYRIDADGAVVKLLTRPAIQRPNGIVVSPDDKTLYLIEANSQENGARMIRVYDLSPGGEVSNMRVHYNFYPGRSADGMTVDVEGNIYAAAGLHRRRGTHETLDTQCGIHVISPQGKRIDFIPIPEDTITNCAFGGPDMKTLYVTAGKTLFQVRTKIAGTRR